MMTLSQLRDEIVKLAAPFQKSKNQIYVFIHVDFRSSNSGDEFIYSTQFFLNQENDYIGRHLSVHDYRGQNANSPEQLLEFVKLKLYPPPTEKGQDIIIK